MYCCRTVVTLDSCAFCLKADTVLHLLHGRHSITRLLFNMRVKLRVRPTLTQAHRTPGLRLSRAEIPLDTGCRDSQGSVLMIAGVIPWIPMATPFRVPVTAQKGAINLIGIDRTDRQQATSSNHDFMSKSSLVFILDFLLLSYAPSRLRHHPSSLAIWCSQN